MMKMLNKKRKKGFTLIELIVVIAILGILAAIAIPRLTNVQAGAQGAADTATLRTIESAWSIFNADTTPDTWPGDYIAGATLTAVGANTGITIGTDTYTLNATTGLWEKN